jgi:hypothetical protein
MRNRQARLRRQHGEQHPCPLEIKRFEALTKPIIQARQQFTGCDALASIAPKPRQTHGGPELPGFSLLLPRNRERLLEMRFRFADVGLRREPCNLLRDPMYVGFAPVSPLCSIAKKASSAGTA